MTDRVQMGALVFGPVTGIAEGLQAAGMLADVGFLARVAPQVDLQVLQAGKSLGAALKLTQNRLSHSHSVQSSKTEDSLFENKRKICTR